MTKVLVVEDDKFLIKAYAAKLKKEGFDTILASNGEDGLRIAAEEKPDIILLDLVMPKKDGFDVLYDLKQNKKLKNIPVVVLSNLGQPEDIEKAKKMGAKDYLVKSNISMKDIVDKIKELTA